MLKIRLQLFLSIFFVFVTSCSTDRGSRHPHLSSSPSPHDRNRATTQSILLIALGLKFSDLTGYFTGSDAGGCEWHVSGNIDYPDEISREEIKVRAPFVEGILNVPVWDMTDPNTPSSCKKAYFPGKGINSYTFRQGHLTIPPLGLYPPPEPGVHHDYYLIQWAADPKSPIPAQNFCAKRADLKAIEKTHGKVEDCEF